MKLSDIIEILPNLDTVAFSLADGTFVPENFHVTEVGVLTKHFIDCGGTVRTETVANFQLWNANDLDHRLKPQKLLKIIELSEKILSLGNFEIEVEYQTETVGKYELGFDGTSFNLIPKRTACLAEEDCAIPAVTKLAEPNNQSSCCAPGGNCC